MSHARHLQQIIDYLKTNNERVTGHRKSVLEYLCDAAKPVNVKQLEHALPEINQVTLYRILDFLQAHKVVRSIPLDTKEQYFELSDDYHEHHHHLVCRKCGKIRDVECELSIPTVADFIPEMHAVTVYGHCTTC